MPARKRIRLASALILSTLWTATAWGALPTPPLTTSLAGPAAVTGSGNTPKVLPAVPEPAAANSSSTVSAQANAPQPAAGSNRPADQAQAGEAAKTALSPPKISQLRPTGPITVTANHAELVGGNEAIYVGNVRVRSNTVKMNGSRMEWRQKKGGQFIANLTGHPANLDHASTGPEDPSISARANTLIYDSAAQTLTLNGDARLTRGENIVTGNIIRYDIAEKRVQATGSQSSQVKMIIEPPPPKTSSAPSMPPASGGGH